MLGRLVQLSLIMLLCFSDLGDLLEGDSFFSKDSCKIRMCVDITIIKRVLATFRSEFKLLVFIISIL